MNDLDKNIVNSAIAGLYAEYGYKVSKIPYNIYDKKLDIVNKLTKKRELLIQLINDTLFVDTINKHLFSVDLIERFANLLNIKISLLEI